jgi:ABC-type transport system substrate-binding protein
MLVAIRRRRRRMATKALTVAWRQGINITLSSVDPSTMFRYYAKDSFSPTNYNWGHWDNAEVTDALKKLRRASIRRRRRSCWQRRIARLSMKHLGCSSCMT